MTAVQTENLIQHLGGQGNTVIPTGSGQNTVNSVSAVFEGHLEKALKVGSELDSRNMNSASPLLEDVQTSREDALQNAYEDDKAAADEPSQEDDVETKDTDKDEATSEEKGDTEEAAQSDETQSDETYDESVDVAANMDINPELIVSESAASQISGAVVDTTGTEALITDPVVSAQASTEGGVVQNEAAQVQLDQMAAAVDLDGDGAEGLNFNTVAQQLAGAQAAQALNAQNANSAQTGKVDPVAMVLEGAQASKAGQLISDQAALAQGQNMNGQNMSQNTGQQQAMPGQAQGTMTQAEWLTQQQTAADANSKGVSPGKSFIESLISGKQDAAQATTASKPGADGGIQVPHVDAGRTAAGQSASVTPDTMLRAAPQTATSTSALTANANTPQAPVTASAQPIQPQPQPTQGTVATQQAQNPQGTQQQKATEQVALSIRRGAESGNDKITIRLDPPELGRVDVKLTLTAEGSVTAKIMANNQDTLDLLKRDSRELERALRDAGLDPDSEGMEFELSEDGASEFADRTKDGKQNGESNSSSAANSNSAEDGTDEEVTQHVRSSDHVLDVVA